MAEVERVRVSKDETEDDLVGRRLTMGEITTLMNACSSDKSASGARDGAMIALGYGLGLRRVEIVRAQLRDYRRDDGVLLVKGKGNKVLTSSEESFFFAQKGSVN